MRGGCTNIQGGVYVYLRGCTFITRLELMSDTNNILICLQQNVGRSYLYLITLLQNALESETHCVLV
jgi:hypothetical protein